MRVKQQRAAALQSPVLFYWNIKGKKAASPFSFAKGIHREREKVYFPGSFSAAGLK